MPASFSDKRAFAEPARPLPRLRRDLDALPSPVAEQPGLLLRDPYLFSETMLIVPPGMVSMLAFFDGQRTDYELAAALMEANGEVRDAELSIQMQDALSRAGFLHDAVFERMRDHSLRAFAQAAQRQAAHIGAYPEEAPALREKLDSYLASASEAAVATHIAAPHVSPDGGWHSYAAAYRALRPPTANTTFVILGTSHYGEPERFGLTRKRFVTPLGETRIDLELATALERDGGPAVTREDYCHRVEHSIEFQVVFLQHLFGADVRILPILCGAFARSTTHGGTPEDDDGVARFLDTLGNQAARCGDRLRFVLGVDMAHIGRRYGDQVAARAGEGHMRDVEARDRARMQRIVASDAEGFWQLVQEGNRDDLQWCGASPFYTFLSVAAPVPGRVLHYEQWNIDAQSVVSFAGLAFGARMPEEA